MTTVGCTSPSLVVLVGGEAPYLVVGGEAPYLSIGGEASYSRLGGEAPYPTIGEILWKIIYTEHYTIHWSLSYVFFTKMFMLAMTK